MEQVDTAAAVAEVAASAVEEADQRQMDCYFQRQSVEAGSASAAAFAVGSSCVDTAGQQLASRADVGTRLLVELASAVAGRSKGCSSCIAVACTWHSDRTCPFAEAVGRIDSERWR